MGIFSSEEKKSGNNCIAVFDIGSASVGGLLLQQEKDKAPQVISSVRKTVDFSKERTSSRTWQIMHDAFVSVSNNLKKSYTKTPDVALCVFSSPWYVSQTRIVRVKRDEPFKITEDFVEKIIENEKEEFKKMWCGTVWKEENASTFFEYSPIRTILNGYEVNNPYGKSVSSMELYAYLSLGVDFIEENIKRDILDYIKPHNVYFHSFPFVLFNVLKYISDTKSGFLFVDMSGEITDVFYVKNNTIEEINSFPKGENFFARRLASALNIDLVEARGTFSQYIKKELQEEYSKKAGDVLQKAGKEWGDELKNLLSKIAKEKYLPQKLYFCGETSTLKEINSQVLGDDFSKFTIFGKPFDVQFLHPGSLKYHFDFKKGFSENKDIFLLISSLYANEFIKD